MSVCNIICTTIMTYTMTCTCGETMSVETADRGEAVGKFKGMMDENAISAHMAEKHPGQPLMSVAACHAMIEKEVQPAE